MIRVANKHSWKHAKAILQPGAVYVGRPSKWGNPYTIGQDGTREEVISLYRDWIAKKPELIGELAAMNPQTLVCWCAPLPCHADVLKELLEARMAKEGE